jgi:putative peptidoglycan lipid II flippase
LGPTYLGNTYAATSFVPNLVFEFLTGSLLVTLLVPALVRHVDAKDSAETNRIAGSFLGLALAGFAVLTVLGIALAPLLARLLAVQASSGEVARDERHAGVILLVLSMPQVLLYAVAGIGGAVMNAHGRFALAAAAPALENFGLIATMLTVLVAFGTSPSVHTVSTTELVVLGVGSTAAVALHAAAQWWGAHRVGVTLIPRRGWGDAEVREVVRRGVPSLGYAGLNALRQLGATVIANAVQGGVVAFYLAENFFHLPTAVGSRPVALALLPRLARLFQTDQLKRFRVEFTLGIARVCFLAVPFAIGYLALARPLADAVSFGQFAGPGGAPVLALALVGLAPGVIGETGFVLATHASYAQGDAHGPFVSMLYRTVVSTGGMVAAAALLTGKAVIFGLAVAISVGDLLSAWLLSRRVQRRLPAAGEGVAPAVRRAVGASVLTVGPAYLAAVGVAAIVPGTVGHAVGMIVAALLGLALYLGLQRWWRSPELAFFLTGVESRRR